MRHACHQHDHLLPYAQYDDGNAIFGVGGGLYDNFNGIKTIPNTNIWSPEKVIGANTPQANNALVNNGLTLNVITFNSIGLVTTATYSGALWFEGLIKSTTNAAGKHANLEISQLNTYGTTSNVPFTPVTSNTGFENGYGVGFNGITIANTMVFNALGVQFNYNGLSGVTTPNVIGIAWPATGVEFQNVGYKTISIVGNTLVSSGPTGNYLSLGITSFATTPTFAMNVLWVRTRIYPPSGILPTTSVGTSVLVPNVILTVSNTIVDVGQYETLTASVYGGTVPYTVNFLVSAASVPGNIAYNALFHGALSPNTFQFQIISTDTASAPWVANVTIADASSIPANSVYSTITVNPSFTPGSWTASNTYIDIGQNQILTAAWSGGTGTVLPSNYLSYIPNYGSNNVVIVSSTTKWRSERDNGWRVQPTHRHRNGPLRRLRLRR